MGIVLPSIDFVVRSIFLSFLQGLLPYPICLGIAWGFYFNISLKGLETFCSHSAFGNYLKNSVFMTHPSQHLHGLRIVFAVGRLCFQFFYPVTIHWTQSRDPCRASLLCRVWIKCTVTGVILLTTGLLFCRCKNIHWFQGTVVAVRNWNGLCRTQAGQWICV